MAPKYHVFYVWAYGMDPKYECLDDEEKVLALVKKAKEPESAYRAFHVIFGKELEFEPATVVQTYRVKSYE